MVESLPEKPADLTPAVTPDDEQPEWVTPDMVRYVDEVFRTLTVREVDGKRGDTTKVMCRRINLPENQDALWSAALPPRVWANWIRDNLMRRFAYQVPELWATAYRCSTGQGTNDEIRGLGHFLAFAKRMDPEFAVQKQQIKHEMTFGDHLKQLRNVEEPE